jgi:ADP-ribosylglycohydrolase
MASDLFGELKDIPIAMPKQLPTDITLNRFRGVIWGCALGDAMGLQFEGCDARRARLLIERAKGVVSFPNSGANGDKIRGVVKGDWTDDTDHMVLLLESSYFDSNGTMRVDNKLFASKLVLWRHRGFPELGDICGQGIGSLTAKLTAHPRFTIDPHTVAMEVYKSMGGSLDGVGHINAPAPNGALMRIAPLALSRDYLTEITEHVTSTHFDSRCLASCLLQCEIIRCLLKGDYINDSVLSSYYDATSVIVEKEFASEYKKYYDIGLESKLLPDVSIFTELKVGEYSECNRNGYTLVAMSIMLWAVRCAEAGADFVSIINAIVSAGGDADTNAAIAGAVLGARFGYSALPKAWIDSTPHRDWLNKKIKEFMLKK